MSERLRCAGGPWDGLVRYFDLPVWVPFLPVKAGDVNPFGLDVSPPAQRDWDATGQYVFDRSSRTMAWRTIPESDPSATTGESGT